MLLVEPILLSPSVGPDFSLPSELKVGKLELSHEEVDFNDNLISFDASILVPSLVLIVALLTAALLVLAALPLIMLFRPL